MCRSLRLVAFAVLQWRCFAHEQSASDTCDASALASEAPHPDSGSYVQIALFVGQTRNVSSLSGSWILAQAVEVSRFVTPRLVPAVCFFVGLVSISILLQWYRSRDYCQDSGRTEQEAMPSPIALLSNIWPCLILVGIAGGMLEPLVPYICLNFFAQSYTHLHPGEIHCGQTPEADYCKKAVSDNVWWTTVLSVISACVHIGLGPTLGALSDTFGRKSVVAGCEVLKFFHPIALGLFVFFDVSLFVWYALSVFEFLPVLGVWFSVITDLVAAPEHRATTFGLCVVVYEFSRLMGMVVASWFSMPTVVVVSIVLKMANVIYIVLFLRETLPIDLRAPVKVESLVPLVGLSILTRNSLIQRLCLVLVVSEFATSGVDKIGLSYFQKYLAFDVNDNYVNSILGQFSILAWVAFLMHHIIVMAGEIGLLYIAQGFGIVFCLGLYFATSASEIFALQTALSGVVCLIFPATAALKGSMVANSEQGHLQGAVQGVKSLAACLGPVFFGGMFSLLDRNPASFCGFDGRLCSQLIFALGAFLQGLTIPVIASMPHDILQKLRACDD